MAGVGLDPVAEAKMTAMRWADSTEGVQVALHDLGGKGAQVLLAHATGFAGRIWEPVTAHLQGYRCFALDARTHGSTRTPPQAARSWTAVAEDVLAAVAALGLRGCAAAGHSMGAAALLLAEVTEPGTFSSLYCYEPVTQPLNTQVALQDGVLAALTLHRRYVFESLDAARQNFSAKDPFQSFTGPSLEAYLQHCFRPLEPNDQPGPDSQPPAGAAAITLACPRQDESELYRLGRYHGLFERLGEITCPVVIASGARQPGTPSHFAPAVAAALDLSRFLQYPDLGHFGPQQDPARIAADIGEAWRSPPTRKQPT